eukprot:m.12095 g.12095  ORF g.12095 m.12095 type:complete len:182 (+) comp9140_c0_seq1:238-783(+)
MMTTMAVETKEHGLTGLTKNTQNDTEPIEDSLGSTPPSEATVSLQQPKKPTKQHPRNLKRRRKSGTENTQSCDVKTVESANLHFNVDNETESKNINVSDQGSSDSNNGEEEVTMPRSTAAQKRARRAARKLQLEAWKAREAKSARANRANRRKDSSDDGATESTDGKRKRIRFADVEQSPL